MPPVRDHDGDEPLLAKPSPLARPSLGTYVAFTMVGLGQGWLSSDALFQQVPQLQQTLPEKAALAAYMGGATTAGSMCSLCLVALLTVLRVRTSQFAEDVSVAMMIVATVACLVTASLGWDVTSADGTRSAAILALSATSGAIGALRMAICMPWHLRYDSRLISANLLGGTISAALIAALSALQRPGGDSRFGPSAFFALVALLSLPSAGALCAIVHWRLGLLPPSKRMLASPQPPATQPVAAPAPRAPRRLPSLHEFRGLDRPPLPPLAPQSQQQADEAGGSPAAPAPARPPAARRCAALPSWAPRALALGGAYVLAQSLVWGVTPGVLPYAAAHASAGERPLGLSSHELLAVAMQASFFGLFVGAAAALFVEVHAAVGASFALIGLNSAIPLIFALDLYGRLRGPLAAIVLVGSCTLARGLEGFVVPAIFRAISSDETYGEARAGVQRALVIAERLATMAGSVGTLALVTRVLDRSGIRPSDDTR